MSVREVLIYPDPRLRQVCLPVQPTDGSTQQIVTDLIDTMTASGHSVGIAAPQIGEAVRVVVIDCSQKVKNSLGQLVFINPEITEREGVYTMREGCMSLPDYVGIVTRSRRITVKGFDIQGQIIEVKAQKFEAVVLQHEIDHLDGILFIDRVSSLKTDVIRRTEWARIKEP